MDEQGPIQEQTGSEVDSQRRRDYEAEANRFARHQWNLNYPLNVGVLMLTAIAAAGVSIQST